MTRKLMTFFMALMIFSAASLAPAMMPGVVPDPVEVIVIDEAGATHGTLNYSKEYRPDYDVLFLVTRDSTASSAPLQAELYNGLKQRVSDFWVSTPDSAVTHDALAWLERCSYVRYAQTYFIRIRFHYEDLWFRFTMYRLC